jgi:hypothetical protein
MMVTQCQLFSTCWQLQASPATERELWLCNLPALLVRAPLGGHRITFRFICCHLSTLFGEGFLARPISGGERFFHPLLTLNLENLGSVIFQIHTIRVMSVQGPSSRRLLAAPGSSTTSCAPFRSRIVADKLPLVKKARCELSMH